MAPRTAGTGPLCALLCGLAVAGGFAAGAARAQQIGLPQTSILTRQGGSFAIN